GDARADRHRPAAPVRHGAAPRFRGDPGRQGLVHLDPHALRLHPPTRTRPPPRAERRVGRQPLGVRAQTPALTPASPTQRTPGAEGAEGAESRPRAGPNPRTDGRVRGSRPMEDSAGAGTWTTRLESGGPTGGPIWGGPGPPGAAPSRVRAARIHGLR